MKLGRLKVSCNLIEEPSLEFGASRLHVSPKLGMSLFGPKSIDDYGRHPDTIRLGFIASGASLVSARKWIESCLQGVSGDGEYEDFPGITAEKGFYTNILMPDQLVERITAHDIAAVKEPRLKRDRFEAAVALIDEKLQLLSERDQGPDCVVLALPDELLDHCKVVDFTDAELGKVHRDFRRALKSVAMKHRLPTQILLQRTSEALPDSKNVDHKSRCAWNFFTSMYFKAGGLPWTPHGLRPGTCYVGVSFHQKPTKEGNSYFTSTAQAFDEHGDGLVLRGQDFTWDSDKFGRSPHLPAHLAEELVALTLKRYVSEMKQAPTRVVIHKSSQFWPDEKLGFESALKDVHEYDLLSLNPVSDTRLLRDGQYPVLRGTTIKFGDRNLLYTTGYIPSLQAFPHGHVPSPLMVFDHYGDSDIDELLGDVMVLTKMNWNTASFAGILPITIRFSKVVGQIMSEISEDREPLPQFKYYV